MTSANESIYVETARATYRRAGGYQLAKREIIRDRDNNSPGTESFAFHNATLRALTRLNEEGDL